MWTWLVFALAVIVAAWAYFGLMTLLLLLEGWERVLHLRGARGRKSEDGDVGEVVSS